MFAVSCSDKNEETEIYDFNNEKKLMEVSRNILGEDVKKVFAGVFDDDLDKGVAAVVEVNETDRWGLQFVLLKKSGKNLVKEYETEVFEGSVNESLLNVIKFPSFDYELLYYNSQSYFMGSGGGEIYSYIVDLGGKKVYYAHLVVSSGSPSLFLSEDINKKEIEDFFIMNFKRDYPKLIVVQEDPDLALNKLNPTEKKL